MFLICCIIVLNTNLCCHYISKCLSQVWQKIKSSLNNSKNSIEYWKNFDDSLDFDIKTWCTSWRMLSRKQYGARRIYAYVQKSLFNFYIIFLSDISMIKYHSTMIKWFVSVSNNWNNLCLKILYAFLSLKTQYPLNCSKAILNTWAKSI